MTDKRDKYISIPFDQLATVESVLGRTVVKNQKPHVKIRVTAAEAKAVRKALQCS